MCPFLKTTHTRRHEPNSDHKSEVLKPEIQKMMTKIKKTLSAAIGILGAADYESTSVIPRSSEQAHQYKQGPARWRIHSQTFNLAFHFVIMSAPWITKSQLLSNSLKLSHERGGVGCGIRKHRTCQFLWTVGHLRMVLREQQFNGEIREKRLIVEGNTASVKPLDITMQCQLKMTDL